MRISDERRLEVVRDVGHEVRLEPRHLRLAPDDAVRRDEAEGDHDEQQREGGHEDHRLAPHGILRGRARRLVERHPPRGQRLAEARTVSTGSARSSGRRGVDGPAVDLSRMASMLWPSSPPKRLVQDVAVEHLVVAAEGDQHGPARPRRGSPRRGRTWSPTAKWRRPPRSQKPWEISREERGDRPPRRAPGARRVEHVSLAVEEVDRVEERCLGLPGACHPRRGREARARARGRAGR